MRKWQQDLVPSSETSQQITSTEIKTNTNTEISSEEKVKEAVITLEFTETHMAILIFVVSFFILCSFKPAIILKKEKDRPEESTKINYISVFILSIFTSAIYLGLCNKIFS